MLLKPCPFPPESQVKVKVGRGWRMWCASGSTLRPVCSRVKNECPPMCISAWTTQCVAGADNTAGSYLGSTLAYTQAQAMQASYLGLPSHIRNTLQGSYLGSPPSFTYMQTMSGHTQVCVEFDPPVILPAKKVGFYGHFTVHTSSLRIKSKVESDSQFIPL